MKIKLRIALVATAISILASVNIANANEFSGNISLEGRYFSSDPAFDKQQEEGGLSISLHPEYKKKWDNDHKVFTFSPFFRWDDNDDERTHGDIRELDYVVAKGDWEFQVGIGQVYWGVTESQHLVDIVNQTDAVEGVDGEDKLGQPLFRVSYLTDNGSVDLFLLPYFRERTFTGINGRFRPPLVVDTNATTYESASEENHLDYAFRWTETFDDVDFGLHLFDGTSRDPEFKPGFKNGVPVLIPHYPLITQFGIDLQYTGEAILWKLEVIRRETNKSYSAAVGGFEYTLPAITEAGAELGLLAEYHNDSRGEVAAAPFQNDLFLGTRLTLNDTADSQLLAGAFLDLDNQTKSFRVEASRRIAKGLKVNIEGQVFTDVDKADPLQIFSKDDFIQIELQKFF